MKKCAINMIKFGSEPVYEYRYFKAKVCEFDSVIKTNFLVNDMPKKKHALY